MMIVTQFQWAELPEPSESRTTEIMNVSCSEGFSGKIGRRFTCGLGKTCRGDYSSTFGFSCNTGHSIPVFTNENGSARDNPLNEFDSRHLEGWKQIIQKPVWDSEQRCIRNELLQSIVWSRSINQWVTLPTRICEKERLFERELEIGKPKARSVVI